MKCRFVLPHGDKTQRGEEVDPVGFDYESRVTFIKDRRNILVLHASSGTHWESILKPRVSHPARFMVFHVIERVDGHKEGTTFLTCEELIDFEVRDQKGRT